MPIEFWPSAVEIVGRLFGIDTTTPLADGRRGRFHIGDGRAGDRGIALRLHDLALQVLQLLVKRANLVLQRLNLAVDAPSFAHAPARRRRACCKARRCREDTT